MTPHQPIEIFDAGIGSYAMVERGRARSPLQDVDYLADRTSFPDGGKTTADLLAAVRRGAARFICAGKHAGRWCWTPCALPCRPLSSAYFRHCTRPLRARQVSR